MFSDQEDAPASEVLPAARVARSPGVPQKGDTSSRLKNVDLPLVSSSSGLMAAKASRTLASLAAVRLGNPISTSRSRDSIAPDKDPAMRECLAVAWHPLKLDNEALGPKHSNAGGDVLNKSHQSTTPSNRRGTCSQPQPIACRQDRGKEDNQQQCEELGLVGGLVLAQDPCSEITTTFKNNRARSDVCVAGAVRGEEEDQVVKVPRRKNGLGNFSNDLLRVRAGRRIRPLRNLSRKQPLSKTIANLSANSTHLRESRTVPKQMWSARFRKAAPASRQLRELGASSALPSVASMAQAKPSHVQVPVGIKSAMPRKSARAPGATRGK